MISSPHSGVTGSPELTPIASFSSRSRPTVRCPWTRVGHWGLRSSLPSNPLSTPSLFCSAFHCTTGCTRRWSRDIGSRRYSVIVDGNESDVRFRTIAAEDCKSPHGVGGGERGVTQTRRDVLLGSSFAVGFAAVDAFGGRRAEGSVSRQVKLKDVENPLLQDALRAAVAGDLENAEVLFTELIKEDPMSASGWSNRGSVRISLEKYKQATDDFTKAIELAPEAPVPYLNRAISYEAQGLFDQAIADCKSAIEYDPEEPAAWFNLGNVEAQVNDYNTSLLAYQRASVLAPGIAGYRFRQALVLFQVGRLEEAKKLLQGLVRKYPNYTEAHAALAALLWKEGRRSNAEDQFLQATNIEPLFNQISWVETHLRWPPGVFQAFSKFLSIDESKS